MKNRNYVFKYDIHNNLYNYLEKERTGKVSAYYSYNYKNDTLLRYDSNNKLRIFNQFDSPCKLTHRFEAGESWIRVVTRESNIQNLNLPKIKKHFAINSENQVVKFNIQEHVLEQF